MKPEPPTETADPIAKVLARAKDAHDLSIAWSRHMDFKTGSIQTAASALGGGMIILLGQKDWIAEHPYTRLIAIVILFLLLLCVWRTLQVVNPSLKYISKPEGNRNDGMTRDPIPAPTDTIVKSHLYFADIADPDRYPTRTAYRTAAQTAFTDDNAYLQDLLDQTYSNASRVREKVKDINDAASFLFWAIAALLPLTLTFFLEK